MFATSARIVPDMALAWLELPSALHFSVSPSFSTPTFGSIGRAIVPSGPFTEICTGVMFTSTPLGTGMGFFAMRDMAGSLRDDAEHFATNTGGPRLAVGHHPPGGGHDRHAPAVHHPWGAVAGPFEAAARRG